MNKISSLLYILVGVSLFSCKEDPFVSDLEKDRYNSKLLNTSNSNLPSNYIRSVEWKDKSTIYISYGYYSEPNGIMVYNYDNNTMTSLSDQFLDFKDVICNDMIKDNAGNMYFALSTGLTVLTPPGLVSNSTPINLDSDGLIKMAFDKFGVLWAISKNKLYKYENNIWSDYSVGSISELTTLVIDSKNNKWVGTYGKGIYRFNDSNTLDLHTDMFNSDMLSDYVMSIAITANDEVYMFSYAQNINLTAGLYKFQNNDWIRMENLPYDYILAPGYTDGNHIWFGSRNWGLVCYDGSKWNSINEVNSAFTRDDESHSMDISISEDNKIASGLFNKGLFIGANIYGN